MIWRKLRELYIVGQETQNSGIRLHNPQMVFTVYQVYSWEKRMTVNNQNTKHGIKAVGIGKWKSLFGA